MRGLPTTPMTKVGFAFTDTEKAYSTFKAAADQRALKTLIDIVVEPVGH